ncbi:MAG: hypothetical protein JST26_12660 [Bacteroidetes bacterium]|nr:hypothetical protein [Bacteroidota bacterium]
MISLRHFFFILIFSLTAGLKAQHMPHGPELGWALAHPFAALKIKHRLPEIREACQLIKTQQSLDTFISGGKLDAFRHSFAMAYLSQSISVRKLRKLGIAHEKNNYLDFKHHKLEDGDRADSLACAMDLLNNETGFRIGIANKRADIATLKTLVTEAIQRGDAVCLKRNAAGQYLRCDGSTITISDFKDKWYIPKCLIKSSE